MSKTTKIVLGVIGGVALVCLVGVAMASLGFAAGRAFQMPLAAALGTAPTADLFRRDPQAWAGEDPYGRRMPNGMRRDRPDRMPMDEGWFDDRRGWMMPEGLLPEGLEAVPFFGGMHGGWLAGQATGDPPTVDEAVQAAEAYLTGLEVEGLEVAEVMIFDNHAYVEVVDAEGQGAIELLVFPGMETAFLEFGPSMMWNTTYGMHGEVGPAMMPGRGMRFQPQPSGEVSVTADQAVEAAQAYLDEAFPGRTVEAEAEAFPGYYTLHVLQDGEVVGMLSVNATTGQVWYHHWHGQLVEMKELSD